MKSRDVLNAMTGAWVMVWWYEDYSIFTLIAVLTLLAILESELTELL